MLPEDLKIPQKVWLLLLKDVQQAFIQAHDESLKNESLGSGPTHTIPKQYGGISQSGDWQANASTLSTNGTGNPVVDSDTTDSDNDPITH